MQWYALKTWTGREEELAGELRRTVPPRLYGECFVIYQERIWRKQQRNVIHREILFPGYVFLTCRKTESEPLFCRLELVPAAARLMAAGSFTVLPLTGEDQAFLERISGPDHIVRLSYVSKDDRGNIRRIDGPLEACLAQVEKYQFKKRFVIVHRKLLGEERVIVLGIVLNEDVGTFDERKTDHKQVYAEEPAGADAALCAGGYE